MVICIMLLYADNRLRDGATIVPSLQKIAAKPMTVCLKHKNTHTAH